jgi:hypothetical protein
VAAPKYKPVAEHPLAGDVSEYPEGRGNDGPIVVANEFADVVVRRVETRNGMRLDIWSPAGAAGSSSTPWRWTASASRSRS